MAIFAIFKVGNPAAMGAALQQQFPNNYLYLGDNEWLVSAKGTAQDVSAKLGVSDGDTGSAIIFSMASYYGRAATNIWEWIKTKAEEENG